MNNDKRIVVFGASRGIGQFIADNLAKSGNEVFRVSRTVDMGRYLGCNADVTNWPEVLRCAEVVAEKWRHIDALVYCVGIHGKIGPCLRTSSLEWENVMRTNLNGLFNAVLAFHPLLNRAPKKATVLAFAGGGAVKARPNFTSYAVSKAALVRFIDCLAEENPGINFNAIAPGAILTDMTREIINAGPQKAGKNEYEQACGLKNDPVVLDKILRTIEFLLSEEGDNISGRLIPARHPDLRSVNWSDRNLFCLRHNDGR
jgi:3-oxoacyl-[acyl-carrier protein] reductase